MPPRSRDPAVSRARRDPDLIVEQVTIETDDRSDAGSATIDVRQPSAPVRASAPTGEVAAGIDIRWTDDGACIVELRGRPTRPMLAKARDLLWSHSPQDRLTVVVSEAVLTRELFAMLIAGRRRLSASGVFEIVGLDAPGARSIANSFRPPG